MRKVDFIRVHSEHFLVHEMMDFEFPNGQFIVITGNNGSGKTAIFDSVCWALYDVTTKGITGDEVIRNRSNRDTYVKLEWMIDGDQYYVENYRKHHKWKDEKRLFKNGVEISSKSDRRGTNEKIEQILLPQKIFFNCLLFSQYMKESFTQLTPGKQKDIFDLMLSLKEYDEYYEKIGSYLKRTEQSIQNLTTSIPLLKSSLEMNEGLLCSETENRGELEDGARIRQLGLDSDITLLQKNIDLIKPEIEEIDNLRETLKKLCVKRSVLSTQVESLQDQLDIQLNNMKEGYNQQFKIEKGEIESSYQHKISIMNMEASKLQSNVENIELQEKQILLDLGNKKIYKIGEINEGYQNSIDSKIKNESQLKIEFNIIDEKINSLNKNLLKGSEEYNEIDDKLSIDIPICYACGQSVTGKNLEQLRERSNILIREGRETKSKIIKLQDEYKQVEESIEKVRSILQELIYERQVEIDGIEADYKRVCKNKREEFSSLKDSLVGDRESLLIAIASLETERDKIISNKKEDFRTKGISKSKSIKENSDNQISKINVEIGVRDKEIGDIEINLEKKRLIENQYIDLRSNLQAKNIELNDVEPNLKKMLDQSDRKTRSFKQAIEGISMKIIDTEKDMGDYDKRIDILGFWKEAFSDRGIKGLLLDEAIPLMNERSRELSNITSGIRVRFDSQTTLKSGDQRNKFSVNVVETRNLADKRDNLSGGEGRLVDLITLMCLRAVLEHMYDLSINIYLFDEPLDALDTDNVVVGLNIIRKIAADKCSVLITHTWKDSIECDQHLPL